MTVDWAHCHYIRSALWMAQGRGCVTATGLVWEPAPHSPSLLGARPFTISRSDIVSVEQGKFGLNRSILCLRTKDGRRYRFLVDDLPSWMMALPSSNRCDLPYGAPKHRTGRLAGLVLIAFGGLVGGGCIAWVIWAAHHGSQRLFMVGEILALSCAVCAGGVVLAVGGQRALQAVEIKDKNNLNWRTVVFLLVTALLGLGLYVALDIYLRAHGYR